MKKQLYTFLTFLIAFLVVQSSNTTAQPFDGKRPKLVVGVVIDQMRWDYLYRYYDRYGTGGFKRLISQGFSAENTMIPYAQTVTAAGHACVYTGSVPAIHGIMGNEWYDVQQQKGVYCVEDDSVKIVGGVANSEPMSPKNLKATTISDELRLATNFRSKVVGVSLKDRGSILPAGHTGTAYWYESGNGSFVSSTFYMNELPKWVQKFNEKKLVDKFYKENWNTLYPLKTYVQSDEDNVPYEGKSTGEAAPVFPHLLKQHIGKNYGAIRSTPYGNNLTLEFAKMAISEEEMGRDEITDLLAVSLSSPDYIGHQYGPNSVEVEDNYLRLDKELSEFFQYLDEKVGKNQYVFFLTADHAVAHTPGFLQKHKIAVQSVPGEMTELNKLGMVKFGFKPVLQTGNSQLYLNHKAIDSAGKTVAEISDFLVGELMKMPQVLTAFSYATPEKILLPAEVKEQFIKGYNAKLAGDLQVVLKAGYFHGGATGTTHGSWYPYDAHIPLVFMGWNIAPGRTNRVTQMTDISATLAALLRIQMPSGCVGQPIIEILPQR